MKKSFGQFIEEFDHRTGLHRVLRDFLYEEIPASSGWHQVFGSVALFLILIQFFTGAILAFNYAPTPGDAYTSLRYILTEVTGGRLMRGLHHWGASMMIVVVVLHMMQVFLWGAYKRPREGTWVVGVMLLLLSLSYGLTGYLLPWDNRAYWGTVVTTQIGASVPLLGPYISRLLGSSEGNIGVVTFARFYGVHVLLLPPATTLLIVFHIYLVRRHGVAPAPGDAQKPTKAFFPDQVFKDTAAVFITFAILFMTAIMVRVPLERMADPTDTAYIPRPEWYFLFLFQTLKVFEGPLEVVGTVVLPALAILALIVTPFVDRGKAQRIRQRTLAFGVIILAAVGWGGLTAAAVKSTPPQTDASRVDFSSPTQWMGLTPAQLAGIAYYRTESCSMCHNVAGGTPKAGPNLLIARRQNAEWLMAHFRNPSAVVASGPMPKVNLTDAQLRDLSNLMQQLTPDNSNAIDTAPQFVVRGAEVFQNNHCNACHQVNGVEGGIGPALNGLSARRTEAWVMEHFQHPNKLSPGTPMPPYHFSLPDLQNEVSYLFTLPEEPSGQ